MNLIPPGIQLHKQEVEGHKISVAGLEAPGWLLCPREGLKFTSCTSLWSKAESLEPPPGGLVAPKSWPGAGMRGEEPPALGQEAGAAEWAL